MELGQKWDIEVHLLLCGGAGAGYQSIVHCMFIFGIPSLIWNETCFLQDNSVNCTAWRLVNLFSDDHNLVCSDHTINLNVFNFQNMFSSSNNDERPLWDEMYLHNKARLKTEMKFIELSKGHFY